MSGITATNSMQPIDVQIIFAKIIPRLLALVTVFSFLA